MGKMRPRAMVPWWERETYRQYARRATSHLASAREGMRVRNIRSKRVGVMTEDIHRNHPYVQVVFVRKTSDGPRKIQTAWHAENTAIYRPKKK